MEAFKISLQSLAILFGHNSNSKAQTIIIDSCGLDACPLLTKYEISFFDSPFKEPASHKNQFDFINKTFAFNHRNRFLPKDEYFKMMKSKKTDRRL
jgi:hypothetical protein